MAGTGLKASFLHISKRNYLEEEPASKVPALINEGELDLSSLISGEAIFAGASAPNCTWGPENTISASI